MGTYTRNGLMTATLSKNKNPFATRRTCKYHLSQKMPETHKPARRITCTLVKRHGFAPGVLPCYCRTGGKSYPHDISPLMG